MIVSQISHQSQVAQRIVKPDAVAKLSIDRRCFATTALRRFIVALVDGDVAKVMQRVRSCKSIALLTP